jgi:hypothetical protein
MPALLWQTYLQNRLEDHLFLSPRALNDNVGWETLCRDVMAIANLHLLRRGNALVPARFPTYFPPRFICECRAGLIDFRRFPRPISYFATSFDPQTLTTADLSESFGERLHFKGVSTRPVGEMPLSVGTPWRMDQ